MTFFMIQYVLSPSFFWWQLCRFCRNLLLLPHGRMLLMVWSTSSGRSKRRLSPISDEIS
jgi:hypothetical protein